MMLMAMVAVFAIGAVGASAASAASGHIETDIGGCDFIGTTTSTGPTSATVTGLAPDPSGTCGVSGFSGSLDVDWSGTPTATGDITADGLFGDCSYAGSLVGTYSSGRFDLDPSGQDIDNYAGILCPDPVSVINSGADVTFIDL